MTCEHRGRLVFWSRPVNDRNSGIQIPLLEARPFPRAQTIGQTLQFAFQEIHARGAEGVEYRFAEIASDPDFAVVFSPLGLSLSPTDGRSRRSALRRFASAMRANIRGLGLGWSEGSGFCFRVIGLFLRVGR